MLTQKILKQEMMINNVFETPRTNRTNNFRLDTNRKYNDIDNLALFTLKDWKDSIILEWYSHATKEQRQDFVSYVIQRENEESLITTKVLNLDELSYILNLINSREYFLKKAVKEEQHEDGTKSNVFLKFDVFNVLELFESLKRTIVFVYGLLGLDKYVMWRVYGIYHQEDEKLFRTTENAAKLIIRCKLGYEMIEKWTNLFELIYKRSLISKSVWNIITEVTHKNVKAKQNEEERILKGIEDLIEFNNKIATEMNSLSNSEFKMLFSVATYRVEEIDANGKVHVLYRRKRGFIYEGNDYYTPDYSNNRSPSRINLKANQHNQYPGADYMIKDLQSLKKQFMTSYNVDEY